MTIRHLTVFMKVCEKMNMTAAARELFISQPAVSQTISELESYYHVPLFHRQSGKLHLTGAGEKLKSLSTQLLFWNEEIEKTMKNTRTLPPIKVGGHFSAGDNRLANIVADYDAQVGKARIFLYDCNSEELIRRVLASELDLAFVDGDIWTKDLVAHPFISDELVFVCKSDDPLLEGACEEDGLPVIKKEKIHGARWLLRGSGSGSARLFEETMHKHHVEYEIRGRLNSDEAIRQAAAGGLGLGVIAGAGRASREAPVLTAFRIEGIRFPIHLKVAYHREKHLFPEFRQFVDFVLTYAMKDGTA